MTFSSIITRGLSTHYHAGTWNVGSSKAVFLSYVLTQTPLQNKLSLTLSGGKSCAFVLKTLTVWSTAQARGWPNLSLDWGPVASHLTQLWVYQALPNGSFLPRRVK